ncbi:MAG: zinc-binding dehydrogenase, partial [Synechococcaceae cyanobacterium]|nr:zinc-binding dehydrogenase [Synechococcaceae cyanobacterium]
LLQRLGRYPASPGSPVDIPGLEFAGAVEACGSGTTACTPGMRVMGIAGGGTYAEYVTVPETHAVPVPAAMSDADAAAVPEAFVTAHDALTRARLPRGAWLLVHAVGSGVGLAVTQLAAATGAHVVGTSRTASKLERARSYGVEYGIDTSREALVPAVRAATGGRGVESVIDLIGGTGFGDTLACLVPRGRLVLVGLTAGATAQLNLATVLRRRIGIEGTVLRSRSRDEKAETVAAFARAVLPLLAAGTVRPVVHTVLPFERIRDAHALLESNATFGKVVVTVP